MWTCIACGDEQRSKKRPLPCLCGVEDSWLSSEAADIPSLPAARGRSIRASDLQPEPWRRDPCGDRAIDAHLSGGWPRRFSALAWGAPGAGKSSFLYRWASALAPALIVVGEYGPPPRCYQLARSIASDAGADLDGLFFVNDLEHWRDEAERIRARSVVFDSLGAVPNPVAVTRALAEWAAERDGFAWSIAHMTKSGDAAGANALQYWPDATLIFRRLRGRDLTRVRFKKSRFCDVGAVDVSLASERSKKLG